MHKDNTMAVYIASISLALLCLVSVLSYRIVTEDRAFTEQCMQDRKDNEDMLFELKALSAERARLTHELEECLYNQLPYVPPADISEPLPYIGK